MPSTETAISQQLCAKFAVQINRENSLPKREFSAAYQGTKNRFLVTVHFSHTFPAVRKHDLFSLSICK